MPPTAERDQNSLFIKRTHHRTLQEDFGTWLSKLLFTPKKKSVLACKQLFLTALQHSELLLNTTSAISLLDRMLVIDRKTIRNRKKKSQN
jgi:hypothetical protein